MIELAAYAISVSLICFALCGKVSNHNAHAMACVLSIAFVVVVGCTPKSLIWVPIETLLGAAAVVWWVFSLQEAAL